ncbi:MAG: hypothetical protein K8H89_04120 [Flavobacteriales bacterium]|jgi:hypothetical protein|nr:hypothetical protein [Flavobacteriales bacterium]MCB0758377.1 hypothetical protein [Flavobacteriales bacterium]
MSTPTPGTGRHDTNVGFHPPAATDAPATRFMLLIILALLVVGGVVAVVMYNQYKEHEVVPAPSEQAVPPHVP